MVNPTLHCPLLGGVKDIFDQKIIFQIFLCLKMQWQITTNMALLTKGI
jgi:hypothetical protein